MRNVLLLERSEAGVCVRAGEGVELTVRDEWLGDSRAEDATVCAIGIVCVCGRRASLGESPRRAGLPLSWKCERLKLQADFGRFLPAAAQAVRRLGG
jgi:hypothetical protein